MSYSDDWANCAGAVRVQNTDYVASDYVATLKRAISGDYNNWGNGESVFTSVSIYDKYLRVPTKLPNEELSNILYCHGENTYQTQYLNRFIGAGLMIKERTIDPLRKGDIKGTFINNIESIGKTMDTLANPVKSLFSGAGGGEPDRPGSAHHRAGSGGGAVRRLPGGLIFAEAQKSTRGACPAGAFWVTMGW